MPCERCIFTNGKAHSFEKIGSIESKKINIFYTRPSLAQEQDDSPSALTYYLQHFEETRPHHWIWIFDCQGMKSKDLIQSGLGKQLAQTVQQTYFDTLDGIFILNPNWAIKALLAFIKPFLRKETLSKIHLCSNGNLDAIHKIQTFGVSPSDISTLTRKITS